MEREWNGMIPVPYEDFIAGIEAIEQLAIIKQYVRNKDYASQEDIKALLGVKDE